MARINGFLTKGKFESSKFKSFYNLSGHVGDEEKKQIEDFASVLTLMITKFTGIVKDYSDPTNNEKYFRQIRRIIVKLNSVISCNGYSVKYCEKNLFILIFLKLRIQFCRY